MLESVTLNNKKSHEISWLSDRTIKLYGEKNPQDDSIAQFRDLVRKNNVFRKFPRSADPPSKSMKINEKTMEINEKWWFLMKRNTFPIENWRHSAQQWKCDFDTVWCFQHQILHNKHVSNDLWLYQVDMECLRRLSQLWQAPGWRVRNTLKLVGELRQYSWALPARRAC